MVMQEMEICYGWFYTEQINNVTSVSLRISQLISEINFTLIWQPFKKQFLCFLHESVRPEMQSVTFNVQKFQRAAHRA